MTADFGAGALAEALEVYRRNCPKPGLTLDGWRFELNQAHSVGMGLKDNKLGGPYASPAFRRQAGGEIYLIWADGRRSVSRIDSKVLANLPERMEVWRSASYTEEVGAEILPPAEFPEVRLFDGRLAEVVDKDNPYLFAILDRIRKELPAYGVEFVDAEATAMRIQRSVFNSRGISVEYEHTLFSVYASADHTYSESFHERRLPLEEEITALIEEVGKTTAQLKNPGSLASGPMPVLLASRVVEGMVDKYLVHSLSGHNVVNGQAAYRLDDFLAHEQVARTDLNLTMDSTRDLRPGSYRCTREGVPAGRLPLIKDGRLQTPLLDVKYARKAGLAPTPLLSDMSSLELKLGEAAGVAELIKEMPEGLVVYSVLGLHTQDSASGNYSLTAGQALAVENGRITGKVKAVIAGNFLENLKDPRARSGLEPGKDFPALLVQSTVTVE